MIHAEETGTAKETATMPIAPSSQVALDAMRPPALPEIAAAHAELARRPAAANTAFDVGTGGAEAPADAGRAAAPESFRRFEAMVLQTFIQNMLPKEGAAVYGKGMAGDMWKSLLAEKVAGVVAERGGIGIADRMLGGHYADEAKPVAEEATAAPAATADDVQKTDRLLIAPAVLDGMQRSLSGILTDETAAPDTEVQFTTKRG
jgi:flagellar protein FlgJ